MENTESWHFPPPKANAYLWFLLKPLHPALTVQRDLEAAVNIMMTSLGKIALETVFVQ